MVPKADGQHSILDVASDFLNCDGCNCANQCYPHLK